MDPNFYMLSKMYYRIKELMFTIYIIAIFNADLLLSYTQFTFRDVQSFDL